jgi:hypothetical protein
MDQVVFGRWRLFADREATRQAYTEIRIGGPEECGCCHCRNFAAARNQVYPVEVRRLFEDLGIDFSKEVEVYHTGRRSPGLHHYGGWFHCIGRIEAKGDEVGEFDVEAGEGPFHLYFHDKPNLVAASFETLPLLQLEFDAQVPWVVHGPEPE